MARNMGSHRRPSGRLRTFFAMLLPMVLVSLVLAVVTNINSPATATGNGGGGQECPWAWERDIPQPHQEYKYEKTQWYFVKYTHTKTRTWVEGTPATPDQWWNWSPNNTHGSQDYEPAFPNDERGTWQGPHSNGGPQQDTYGTFQTGPPGNSNWFHREHGTPGTVGHWGEWSAYGPWERWGPPDAHTSWQDINVEALGSPEPHASGTYPNGTQWYREWQARNTGDTRQVDYKNGNWTTDSPGSPWVVVAEKTVQDAPIHQGPVRSVDEPDRGNYPDVPWTKIPGSEECPDDNDWKYEVDCDGVSGTNPNYGDSVDSNVRIKNLITGEVRTFNYHGPDNGSGGAFSYEYADEYGMPADWTYYEVQWVQVHTTNYHWEGSLVCGDKPEEPEYYLETSHQTECGAMTITLRNVSPWIYPVSYSIDGSTPDANGPNYGPVVDNRGEAPDDQTKSKALTFTEDQGGGEVTVKYVVAAGTESDLYRDKPVGQVTTVVVDTNCEEPEPEPEGNLKVSSTCESITFSAEGVKPEGATVVFKLDGVEMNPGTHPATPGNHTVELWVNGKKVDSETVKVEECPEPPTPLPGTATASSNGCVVKGQSTGTAVVTVNNTDDLTNQTVTYAVTLGGTPKELTLADGASGSVSFSGLAPGDYNWTVTGPDGTKVSGSVTVEECPPTPEPGTADASSKGCVEPGKSNGSVTVSVVNTDDATDESATYEVLLNGESQKLTLADGEDGSVTFTGLESGDYSWTVTGSDGTTVTDTVTVEKCDIGPPVVLVPDGSITVDCKGNGTAVADNSESTEQFGFEVVVNGQATLYSVEGGAVRNIPFSGAQPGSVVILQDGEATELDSARVPKSCGETPPEQPETPDNPTFETGLAGDNDGSDHNAPYGLAALVVMGVALLASPYLVKVRRRR